MTTIQKTVLMVAVLLFTFAHGVFVGSWITTNAADKIQKAAQEGAAIEIAKLQITNTTVVNKVREIIRTERIYAECRHNPDAFGILKGMYK